MPYVVLGLAAALVAGAVLADSGPCDPAPPGATKPAANKADAQAPVYPANSGGVQIGHADWTMTVTGDKTGKQTVAGGKTPTTMPADTYTVNSYVEKLTSADGKTSGTLTISAPKMKFQVQAGKTTDVGIGSPVTFVLAATPAKNTVTFGVTMFDVSKGNPVAAMADASGKAFAAPKLEIFNAKGGSVAKADMHYG